jgi:ketopantoate reductase
MATYNILIMGASYGSLLATKLLFGGHNITLICLPAEIEAINAEGARVRLPIRGRKEPIELNSKQLPGRLSAAGPGDVDPADYNLVVLAMQEPQYRSPGVRELLDAVARKRVPCMSIMNMPPLPYLKRIPGLATEPLRAAYTDASVWDNFVPGLLTLCSPDPQAIRPPGEKINVLQVTLPTNFKAARFDSDAHTAILRQLQREVEAIRYDPGDGPIELPVKLKVHESIFVPLAKWAMLITGNYRCVQPEAAVTIREAVHNDLEASRAVYEWVCGVCEKLGAAREDLVPFDKYAAAALDLVRPSSAARALFAGAPNIERVDRLVQMIGAQYGLRNPVLDRIVALVDARLAANRKKAAA